MTRFPYTRTALARLFVNLALIALPLMDAGSKFEMAMLFAARDRIKERMAKIRDGRPALRAARGDDE